MVLNHIYQLDLIDSYRTFHPKTAEYTFFSTAHGTFSRTNYMLGHKTSVNKFKRLEIISSFFFNHNSIKLEINYLKKNWKKNKHMENKQYATKKPMGQ